MKKKLNFLILFLGCFLSLPESNATELKYSVFGSAYYGQALSTNYLPFGFNQGNYADFVDFSLIGLDADFKYNDQWSVYTQLVGVGANAQLTNFNSIFQFGYISYATSFNLKAKAGRQGLPIFATSENFRIAAVLPYRTKPQFVYEVPTFAAFDGFSAEQTIDISDLKIKIMAFGGQPVLDSIYTGYDYYPLNLYGIKASLDGDGWRIRAQASRYHNIITPAVFHTGPAKMPTTNILPNLTATTTDFSVGWQIKKYGIVSWAEYAKFISPNGTVVTSDDVSNSMDYWSQGKYYQEYDCGYILLGYEIGSFLPRYTFARVVSRDAEFKGRVTSHIIGFNWTIEKSIILKAEMEFDLFNDSDPYFAFSNVSPFGTQTEPGLPAGNIARGLFVGIDFQI
jgi:hypothetical protein